MIQHKTSPNQWIEVTLGVARKQELPSLASMENKKPRDRKYLTREQLEDQFGSSDDAVEKITAYAHAHNLEVTRSEPGSARMRLAGTVKDISDAFGVTLFDYHHDKLGDFHAHTGPVSIPTELQGAVTGVFGFNNHRHLRRHKAKTQASGGVLTMKQATSSTRQAWFEPPELATIYNFPKATGQGQCIGLLEFGGGVEAASVTAYFQKLGITAPNVLTIPVDNVSTDPTADPDSTGEVMLDIDVAGSLAPSAKIAVYFSPTAPTIRRWSPSVGDGMRTSPSRIPSCGLLQSSRISAKVSWRRRNWALRFAFPPETTARRHKSRTAGRT
jgi:kumamolisin